MRRAWLAGAVVAAVAICACHASQEPVGDVGDSRGRDRGGEEYVPTGPGCIDVQIHAAPTGEFPDLDPYKDCSVVEVCLVEPETGKHVSCESQPYAPPWSGLVEVKTPGGQSRVTVVATCYLQQRDWGGQQSLTPVSSGQTVPVTPQEECDGRADALLYLAPLVTFLPTVDPTQAAATCLSAGRWGAAVAELFDGSVLIAGGAAPADGFDWMDPTKLDPIASSAEIYDPGKGTFEMVGTAPQQLMSERRAFAAAVALPDGRVAIFGGMKDATQSTSTVDLYDPVSMTFAPSPPMADSRARHTATLFSSEWGGYVLLAGGMGTGSGTWEVWSPADGSVAQGSLAEPRWNHTATLIAAETDPGVSRDSVLLIGGEGTDGVRSTVEIFDLATQQMDFGTRLLCSNGGLTDPPAVKKTMHAAALVLKRHFVYVAGGFSDTAHMAPVGDVCVWKTTTESWQGQAGTFMLMKKRGALRATELPGNVVLFSGGLGKKSGVGVLEAVPSVEIIFEYIDPGTGQTVIDIGPSEYPISMLYPRWDHVAVATADGKVLIVGGVGGGAESAKAVKCPEVFNPQ